VPEPPAPPRLSDEQVERYSRQIILAEIGPVGQARLLAARVAIVGQGAAAERALAYLAAAGVGTITAPVEIHAVVDPSQTDVTVLQPDEGGAAPYDVVVLVGSFHRTVRARRTLWITQGRAGEIPPCATCASVALPPPPPVPAELRALRDALLGTVIATEVVKALLDTGTPLRGRVLTYDPVSASITTEPVAPRPNCPSCATQADATHY